MSDEKATPPSNIENELLRARLETQKKDKLVHLLIGLVAGLIVGFFGANWLNASAVPATQTAAAAGAAADDHEGHNHPPGEHPADDAGAAMPEVQAKLKAADENPKNFEAQMEAAAMFHRIKNDDRAIFYLKRAHELRPDDYDALVILANKTFDVGLYSDAKPLYEKALSIKPDKVDVRTDLGTTLFQLGDLDKAIELFEGSLKMDPKHEYTLQNLVVVSIQKGDKARAEDALVRLAAVNASNPSLGPLRKSLEELKTTGKIPTH